VHCEGLIIGGGTRQLTTPTTFTRESPPSVLCRRCSHSGRPAFLRASAYLAGCFGCRTDQVTIVRGAVPLALFGPHEYGTVLGLIATPVLLVNALSPAGFALLVDQFGWQSSLYVLFACSIATWIAIEFMSRWYEGAQSRARKRHDVELARP
jgi:MFS family permease